MTLTHYSNRIRIFFLCGIAGAFLWLGPEKVFVSDLAHSESVAMKEAKPSVSGVCPPFKLRDESGAEIDPVHEINASVPYSPKQTCGTTGCHDYALITEGFHFTQGKGETLPPEYASRYNWVSFPGNYGGNWCSPAPLYRQLAPKHNTNARTIDMTSFDFITATCGNCHPGGGPMEYDRDGRRYDHWMADPASGFKHGGENGLDGDYFKARWSETGVIEADCLLCHMPEYDYKKRNAQLASLNFRWAATGGAGFASISGKVIANETPEVSYNLQRFDADGNVLVHIAPEPRNETCLNCHFKPDWKKRGSAYSTRTDVHMVAGLRCVDCHAAGSRAADPRINGREVHQFGKGDDPAGWVRNDLDDTVRSCEDCHLKGWRNAPLATHEWLPPMHLEKISCQACHIPTRAVKSALVQASDVYNPAPRISPPPKHIWTFYDQEMNFWNHYGEVELFTGADEPTNVTRPTLANYKGKIYPVNRVHSAWVGYEEEGKEGLNQLFMPDFFKMWKEHVTDPGKNWPQLASIKDDNQDEHLEVNRPEEIDALLEATLGYLTKTGFPLDGKRLVYVNDSRVFYSSSETRTLDREPHEATPYASVYKFSHDVAPAQAALGMGGCIDCHSSNSSFFFAPVLDVAFSPEDGQPKWVENHTILGLSPFWIRLGTWREEWLKPATYFLLAILALLVLLGLLKEAALRSELLSVGSVRILHRALVVLSFAGALYFAMNPGLRDYMWVRRFTLDANHSWIGVLILVAATAAAFIFASLQTVHRRSRSVLPMLTLIVAGIAGVFGALMLFTGPDWLGGAFRFVYTGFDAGLAVAAALAVALVLKSSWSTRGVETL
jgi:predicted membrane channel-forming protein YqfA (hemolysin III family)